MQKNKLWYSLIAILILTSMVLSSCGPKAEPAEVEAPVEEAVVEEEASMENQLEIYSWWAGDEGPALEALIALYGEMYPDVEVINATVAGGSGTEAKAVLKTRMLGGDPPDTFQVHAGQELIGTWVVADRMQDLTFLYEEEGWFEKYPQGLIDMMSTEDGVWSVPVNIHRSNVMWFIPENLETWGVDVPASWDDFLGICPDLQAQGVVPLALARNWTHNHLWEAVAVAELGVDGWNALWAGEKAFTDADVVAAWEKFGQILDCTNADATSLSWQQATDMVISGDAAFNEMGDWAMTYFTVINGLEPGVDYSWSPSFGTDGVFIALSDSFGLPQGAPNRDNVINWLKLMGSVEGQDAFNPLKGSIAAHFDSDLTKYNTYLQSAAADWGTDTVVGSLQHGAVANETFMNGFASAMEIFLSTGSAEATSEALQELSVESGIYTGMVAPVEEETMADASGELEIYSWWAGDEGPALEALIALYGEMYPDVEVINATVAGGSGTEAKAVLKTRMLGGDPPDTFQVHAGQELIGTWVVADRMQDLTFLYEEEGWFEKYPQGLIDMMSTEDGVWSVPVNIHRSNVMWFIPENLETWGVDVPASWDDFLGICPDLQAQGVVPLALARNWTHNHLWEAVAVAELGVDGWNALWAGEKAFTDADVVAAWEKFGQILDCTNADATSLSWQQATDMVISGDAAFNEMGDWAMTYFTVINGLEPGVDYSWSPSFGTDGVFIALSDSFGLPQGAPNRDNVINWLKLMGSVEGQDAFNPLKGSIAAHFDSDLTKYNAYLQSAAADWGTDTVVGSLQHGAVANETFMNGFASAMEIFLSTGSAEATSEALQELCVESDICE
ncbi:MAG: extracellular solute-binding protein [Anaerolineaceae bacterium]|nr:extracellular solute-binding protein [Anaerolineaceae bacterium]